MDLQEADFLLLVQVVFFGFLAWYLLVNVKPDWVRVVTGVASAIIALLTLFVLID